MLLALIAGSALVQAQPSAPADLRDLIRAAVVERLGNEAVVDVRVVSMDVDGPIAGEAIPVPGARLGRPVRFQVMDGNRHIGHAIATVSVTVPHLRVAGPVRAGDELTAADVSESVGDPGSVLIEPLPRLADVLGATAVRSLDRGEVVSSRMLRMPLAVRSGERVTLRAEFGGIEASGVATALQSGRIGDIIRVVNPDSRRQLRVRITGRLEAEVLHGT